MRRLSAFEQVSVDGFFSDAKGDMTWAHKQDPEWNEFAASNARGGGALLFGRVTYVKGDGNVVLCYEPVA